jgi:regulator of protease activity HflC (stomatin/prohibitin superfamily)
MDQMVKERNALALPGIPMFFLLLAASIGLAVAFVLQVIGLVERLTGEPSLGDMVPLLLIILAECLVLACFNGLTSINPNEARALAMFGHYDGTVRKQGLQWVNPLTQRRPISVRVRNFESAKLKVNDHDGNPIEIAAVVVWRVTDTAEALFEVDNYEDFLHVQAEAALRNLAMTHPYDAHNEGDISLRSNPQQIADALRGEIQDRLVRAGIEVIEARLSHLAYAPEIANAMLRRQQANAVIAARSRIVEGAVGMVEMALAMLSEKQVVTLDEERKAQMVSNLLVVLCSEHETQPVVNAGTLYA